MSIETDLRYQKAVLWSASGYDDYGQVKVSAPVEIGVRWTNKRSEALDPQGNTIAVDASVVVGFSDIPIGSKLWLGSLSSWYGTGSGGQDDEVMEVVTSSKGRDIKNRGIRRTLGLKKFQDSSPV